MNNIVKNVAVESVATIRRSAHKKSECEYGKDFALDFSRAIDNELGEPAVILTMNLKALPRIAQLIATGRLATEEAGARKKKPTHD
jgi:hypothetical protein|nr:MAG TPA: hypothetical protein [Caudoviricetes sp.]